VAVGDGVAVDVVVTPAAHTLNHLITISSVAVAIVTVVASLAPVTCTATAFVL